MTKVMKAKEKGEVKKFKLKFRQKKAMRQCISIPSSACSITDDLLTVYKRYNLGNICLIDKHFDKLKRNRLYREQKVSDIEKKYQGRSKKFIKEQVDNFHKNLEQKYHPVVSDIDTEIKIMYSQPNGWHALISYRIIPPVKDRDKCNRICALDPGLCTFLTGSDVDGNCFSMGENCYSKLKARFLLIDKLKAKRDQLQAKGRTYRKTNESVRLQYLKQGYAIDDLHNKSIKYLTDNYDIIILPHFNTRQMVKDNNRLFNRKLLALAHYKFRMRLQSKCEALGKMLVIVNESYTSKTCSQCGFLNYHLGSSRHFDCPHCQLSLDRDVNASINILHKSIIS